MTQQSMKFKIKGMQKDPTEDVFSGEFAFDMQNMDLLTNEYNSLLAVTTAKGNSKVVIRDESNNILSITGTVLGYTLINDVLVMFTHSDTNDYIYKFYKNDYNVIIGKVILQDDLGFDVSYPIEAIPFYENEQIQKIYWTDGLNQPRVININDTNITKDSIDFVPVMNLNEKAWVDKLVGTDGVFPSGVIQYACTYYNQYSQETNIFYTSPLLYISPETRASEVAEVVGNSFKINIQNLDTNFEFVRIYSILRTSIDATPIVKRVADISTKGYIHERQETTSRTFNKPISETTFIDGSLIFTDGISASYQFKIGKGMQAPGKDPLRADMILLRGGVETELEMNLTGNYVVHPDAKSTPFILLPGDTLRLVGYFSIGYNNGELIDKLNASVSIAIPVDDGSAVCSQISITSYDSYYMFGFSVTGLSELTETIRNIVNIPGGNTYTFTGTPQFCKWDSYDNQFKEVTVETQEEGVLAHISPFAIRGTFRITNSDGTYYDISNGEVIIYDLGDYSPNAYYMLNTIDGGWSLSASSSTTTMSFVTTVTDVETISYIDNNNSGSVIAATDLLYVGGEALVIKTIAQKDNTLFAGNIKLKRPTLDGIDLSNNTITFQHKLLYTNNPSGTYYNYGLDSLKYNASKSKTLKAREHYRFGIIAQHETGKWSEALWINDAVVNINPFHNVADCVTDATSTGEYVKDGIYGIKARFTLNENDITALTNKGYRKVKGVIVYPKFFERRVIAQGVVSPTVFNVNSRYTDSVHSMSSWFFRPIYNHTIRDIYYNLSEVNSFVENNHHCCVPGNDSMNGEIQCLIGFPYNCYVSNQTNASFNSKYSNNFYIDSSILTFNSPDIEFDDALKSNGNFNGSMRIVGFTPITSSKSALSVETSTGPHRADGGLNFPEFGVPNISGYKGSTSFISGLYWSDKWYRTDDKPDYYDSFMLYPWHANRSLNNDYNRDGRTAMLKYKKMSNLRYSAMNIYLDTPWTPSNGITDIGIFNSEELASIVKINSPEDSVSKIVYQGNLSKVVLPNVSQVYEFNDRTKTGVYPLMVGYNQRLTSMLDRGAYNTYSQNDDKDFSLRVGDEAVNMKYKSTPHAVFGLKWLSSSNQLIIPTLNGVGSQNNSTGKPFWKDYSIKVTQDNVVVPISNFFKVDGDFGGMWLTELYRENIETPFGGQTQEAFESNEWMVCGDAVSLYEADNTTTKLDAKVYYTEGDTYLQRYDCLKTYPASLEDQNSVVEILSFLCETRINIDGRCDRNRGNLDNRLAMPSNFNIINKVYSQNDNYFTYRALNYDRFSLDTFPNTIAWTKSKLSGDIIDNWTNVLMTSILDVDGVFGPVNALRSYNNELLFFQDKAFGILNYNSRVQINPSDGVPIEIANSGKVDGKRYLSTKIGTNNKWSINQSTEAMYFIDSNNKGIYIFNGEVNNLTDKLGFHSWASQRIVPYSTAVPGSNSFSTHIDIQNGNVYFINGSNCIVYSERLKCFTSFMSYEGTPYMFNAFGYLMAIRESKDTDIEGFNLWKQNVGTYGKYFDVIEPSSITFLANQNPELNKTFSTLDLRADLFAGTTFVANEPFNKLEAWNEYQYGTSTLLNTANKYSSFKPKFRVWRAQIPRDTYHASTNLRPVSTNRFSGMDRMSNPWLYLKLTYNNASGYKMVFHDAVVNYNL